MAELWGKLVVVAIKQEEMKEKVWVGGWVGGWGGMIARETTKRSKVEHKWKAASASLPICVETKPTIKW